MKHWLRLTLFLLLIAAAAAIACYFVVHLFPRHHFAAAAADYHYGIHGRLGLTPNQEKALEPVEENFARRRKECIAQIRDGNLQLSEALAADRTRSQRVQSAVDKIHRAQGELQNAVLEHVFAMKPVLTPQQYERLIKMTAEALRDAPELQ